MQAVIAATYEVANPSTTPKHAWVYYRLTDAETGAWKRYRRNYTWTGETAISVNEQNRTVEHRPFLWFKGRELCRVFKEHPKETIEAVIAVKKIIDTNQ